MPESSHEISCNECKLGCIFSSLFLNKESGSFQTNKREIVFKKGETIFKQGTFGTTVVFVKEGIVKLYLEGYNNKDLIIRFKGPQEYLGLNLIFGKNENLYTAEAIKKTKLCMVEISQFKKIVTINSPHLSNLLQHYNEDHEFIYDRLKILGTKNLQGRLAAAILYLADDKLKEYDLYTHITRKDLAELSAMSVESMVRLLNEFKHDKLVNMNGKHIEINNIEMMKILCRVG